jgi:putative ABC transport system ATP-binding protein
MMLTVSGLTKTFGSGDTEVRAVRDVSFAAADGTFAAILGRSGSGKSTLLSLLGGLDRPTAGKVEVDGAAISSDSDRALIRYRRERVGFVFQSYQLIPNLDALENVMIPLEFAGVAKSERRARAAELLDRVGISGDKQHRRPAKLSGGEQQRVAIARALANQPRLILADEPTGNLDNATGETIIDLLQSLAREDGAIVLVVTHDPTIAGRTDVSYTMEDGALTSTSSSTA